MMILVLGLLWSSWAELPAEAVADNNRGVGLMGRFEYAAAADVFGKLVAQYPKHPELLTNLAISTLNRQGEGDEALAMSYLDRVLVEDPDHLRASYCKGLLLLYAGKEAEALPLFEKVMNSDAGDAYAKYQVAQILANQDQKEKAASLYAEVIEAAPYFTSAYYGAFRVLQQSGKRAEAREMVMRFQRLKNNPRANTFEFKYTKMGPKGSVMTVDRGEQRPARPSGDVFGAVEDIYKGTADADAALTVADVDGDGRLDLFVAGQAGGRLLKGNAEGGFTAADHPLAAVDKLNSVLWGDIDNDGDLDAYLLRQGSNQLWLQNDGAWSDATGETGLDNSGNSVDGGMWDADHDGDLDLLVVNADGAVELYNNNRDGSWKPLSSEYNLHKTQAGRFAAAGDLDGDRDLDLLVIDGQGQTEARLNDRLWNYTSVDTMGGLLKQKTAALVFADLEARGEVDLVTLTTAGALMRWSRDGKGAWTSTQLDQGYTAGAQAGLALIDGDGDGVWEILVRDQKGLHRWDKASGQRATLLADTKLTAMAVTHRDPARGPEVVTLDQTGVVKRIPAGPGRYAFIAVEAVGKDDKTAGTRSPASGIGTQLALRVGSRWTMSTTLDRSNGPGQSFVPPLFGMGGADKADFIAMLWPDGVFQSELDLESGKSHRIPEAQRQLASCPVLFVWDGETYRFISDILGVAGIGFAVGRDVYAEPRPREAFLMPEGVAKPKDGLLHFKIGEPMEEVCYLDQAHVEVWDLPKDWDMVVNERMHLEGPEPDGAPIFFRTSEQPAEVTNHNDQDITAALASSDFKAAPLGDLDKRFLGLLQKDHSLTLTFAGGIKSKNPVLVMDGWVEYPYSQTMFAAWQAGVSYRAPTLEVRDGDGTWHMLMEPMGYPAGMPRRMAVPLPPLPQGADALRITSNLQIYWDHAFIADAEDCPEARMQRLDPVAARLAQVGFAKRTNGPQMRPIYDYSQREPFWDTRHPDGHYSRIGDVLPLVREHDNALAIFGPGEEVHLSFTAPEAPAADMRRRIVLHTRGWCKDMDLYTKTGETVGPLPIDPKATGTGDKLNERFNTRRRLGL